MANTKNSKPEQNLSFSVAPPYHVIYKNQNPYYPVGPHSHNAVELYLNLTDLPDVLLSDTVVAVPAGTLLIIPPFFVHQLYHVDSVYERYILSINTQWLDSVFCEQGDSLSYLKHSTTPLLLSLDETAKENLIHQLEELLAIENTFSPEAMASLFRILSFLDKLVDKHTPAADKPVSTSTTQQTVNNMIAYIQEHIYENISLSDVAKHFYLNPDYMSRVFKHHVHVSVGHYIALQKTSAAQSLLREGYTVTQAQEKLGYSSYAYFFKTFKKNTGITPSRYRNEYFKGKG